MKMKTDWKMTKIMELFAEQRRYIVLLGASLLMNVVLLMEMVL